MVFKHSPRVRATFCKFQKCMLEILLEFFHIFLFYPLDFLAVRVYGSAVAPRKGNKAFISVGTITPDKSARRGEPFKEFILLGYWRLREAGLITRQGVLAPTANAFFIARKDVRP